MNFTFFILFERTKSTNFVKCMLFESKMVVREIIVVKKPRDDSLQDKPISFPALDNLHLDMMENKKKLKKGLPLIVVKPPAAAPKVVPKKAANYSAAIISGAAGAAAGITAAKASKREEKFTPAPAEKTKKPSSPEPEEEEEGEGEGAELEEEGNLLEDLGEDVQEGEQEEHELEDGEHEVEDGQHEVPVGDVPAGETHAEPAAEENDEYAGLSPEERESKEKEEYIWRFKILKKKYKSRKDIADYNEHDDLPTMKQTYTRTLREIQLEDNCESYRMYLIGGFMLMEFVSNNWMGVDLTGFTAHQMTLMNKYDSMLIELGEKSYNRWGSSLPVEVRLIGFIILQAGIFYLGKIISEKGGGTMGEIFKMFTGAPVPTPGAVDEKGPVDPEAPKKKMRGPSVKVADLKKKVET